MLLASPTIVFQPGIKRTLIMPNHHLCDNTRLSAALACFYTRTGAGNPMTESIDSFAELQLPPALLTALADVGYETPSPIQAACIPLVSGGP